MKIEDLEKAVKEYHQFNAGGLLSPEYGALMYDTSDESIWTDYFYSVGRNEYKKYHSPDIINLGGIMALYEKDVTTENVKNFIEQDLPNFLRINQENQEHYQEYFDDEEFEM